MKIFSIVLFLLVLFGISLGATPAERAKALLNQMTLDEKLSMVRGYNGPYVGNVKVKKKRKCQDLL